jgi:adenylosuccinate synthase
LDVLDDLAEIKICTHYKFGDRVLDGDMPASLLDLAKCEPQFITLPGWKQSIANINKYEDLPQNAKNYLSKIEELLKVPISWIGNGPEREAMLLKE